MADMGLIQGQTPASINEWYVELALMTLKLDFIYQYEIFGGSNVRGGQIIDFLVDLPPKYIPVFVQGSYWHTGERKADTELKLAELESKTRGYFAPPVQIWEDESMTLEAALMAVKEKVGVV